MSNNEHSGDNSAPSPQEKVPYWRLDDKRLGFPLSIEQSIDIDDKKAAQQLQHRITLKQKWSTWLQSVKNANVQTTYTKNNSTFKKLGTL